MSKYLKTEFGCHETDTLCANDDIQVWIMRCLCADGNPMLVGHMPHLNKMLSRLVSGDEEKQVLNFHNAGVVCIEGDEETEDFNVKWVILPEMLT
jgi:phosphohistidine phosphatase